MSASRRLWVVPTLLLAAACSPERTSGPEPGLPAPISLDVMGGGGTAVTANRDSYVRQGAPNQSQGAELSLRLQQSGFNRALVGFSTADIVAAIGTGTLQSATLELTITDNGDNWGTTGRPIDLHRLTSAWTEAGATWNCAIDSNPANSSPDCSGATAWAMSGSTPRPWDLTASASATILKEQTGVVTMDVTADVAAFASGASANNGWILKKRDESQAGRVEFGSRESASAPRLVLVVAPAGFPAWCNVNAALTAGALPAGWTDSIVRGGPGLVNDRLQGDPTDGGARIGATGAAPATLSEVVVEYDALHTVSADHGVSLQTTSTFYWFYDQSFGDTEPITLFSRPAVSLWPSAGGFTPYGQTEVPASFGPHHYRLRLTDSQAEWTVDNAAVPQATDAIPGFLVRDITGFYWYSYTNFSTTWGDNLSVTCH